MFLKPILLCVLYLAFFASYALADPFKMPEKFVYDLTWTGISAGTATLEFVNDGEKMKIVSTARSADWVSVFYTVEDRVESIQTKNNPLHFRAQPVNYRMKIREGKHRKDKEVIFDADKNRAVYIDHRNNEKKEFDLPSTVFDPLSGFYQVRTLKLAVGETVYVTVFDSKKVWNVEVQVLRKEKVTLPSGTFDTIVIKPLMKSEGIFSRKGDIYIWLTDDPKHIPVKMQTKAAVGSIIATLVRGNY
jgi:hypothetical protein